MFQRLYRWTLSLAESWRPPWHGASIAIATSNGIFRISVLERWAGVKRILLLAKQEVCDLRNPSTPIRQAIHFCMKYGYGTEETVGEFLGMVS